MNRRDRLVRALRAEPVDAVPVWFMRQAGRHLPGYRALRARHPILEIVQDPALAVKVTLEPLELYDLDAGVIFADITVPFLGLGVGFRIDPGVGPVMDRPLRSREELDALREFNAERDAGFVGRAIRLFHERRPDRPLVGFAGGPFTLASYLIEGRPTRDFLETRRLMAESPGLFGALLDRLTTITGEYLRMQSEAGAEVLQLFDTWAGALSRGAYAEEVLPRLRRLFRSLEPLGRPTIYFSVGNGHLLDLAAQSGASALGVDWRLSLDRVRATVGEGLPLQGNLDPAALLTEASTASALARQVLESLPDHRGHVFNLGHGVPPDARGECLRAVVDAVHRAGTSTRAA